MDIEKLIEQLNGYFEGKGLKRCVALDAATYLSTMKKYCDSVCGHLNEAEELNRNLQAENEKLRAELERVKEERDAAVESIPHECKTCVYHTVFFNGCTPDHDCTNPDGGCSNNCDRWKWRGQKED